LRVKTIFTITRTTINKINKQQTSPANTGKPGVNTQKDIHAYPPYQHNQQQN